MRYTLWSRDRLLGETELDYVRCMPGHRMGDLIPTALGERLLPSEIHLDSLRLELRGPDGRVISTEWIDVRDTELVATLSRDDSWLDELDDEFEEELDPELQASIDHDVALIEEWFGKKEPPDLWRDYQKDKPWSETPSFPRYQIQVRLLDDSAIP